VLFFCRLGGWKLAAIIEVMPWNLALVGKILGRSKSLAAQLIGDLKLSRQKSIALSLNCLLLECQIAIVTLTNAGYETEKNAIDHFIGLLISEFMKGNDIPEQYQAKMTKLALRTLGKTWRLSLFPEDPHSEESFGKSVIGRTVYYILKSYPLLGRRQRFGPVLRALTFSTSDGLENQVYDPDLMEGDK
jgi:hypothetical protein